MGISIQCGEEASFSSPQAIATAEAAVFPRFRDAFSEVPAYSTFATCAAWDVKPAAAIENQPVTGDIPTLILSGENDPITPPAWGKLAAQTLSNSHYFEFPWVAHGVLFWSRSSGQLFAEHDERVRHQSRFRARFHMYGKPEGFLCDEIMDRRSPNEGTSLYQTSGCE